MSRNYPSDQEAISLILDIGRKMSIARFVAANDGNITIRVSDEAVWVTPTGVNKGDLTADKLLKVRIPDSHILEGTWKPTSEIEMHLNVYRTDDEIMSTAHAHPIYLSVLACAGIELDLPTNTSACCVCGRIPVVPFACSGSRALADSIIPFVRDYHVVNLANHGPIAWGKTPIEAWYRLENAEASAHLALELAKIGRLHPINAQQMQEMFLLHDIKFAKCAIVREYENFENQRPAIAFSSLFGDTII